MYSIPYIVLGFGLCFGVTVPVPFLKQKNGVWFQKVSVLGKTTEIYGEFVQLRKRVDRFIPKYCIYLTVDCSDILKLL